jgi:hypothetical protein
VVEGVDRNDPANERAWILTEIAAFNREVSPEPIARQP